MKKNYLFLAVALLQLTVSCSNDDMLQTDIVAKKTCLTIEHVSAEDELSTRAAGALVSSFTTDVSAFGIGMKNKDSYTDYNSYTNVKYLFNAAGGLTAASDNIMLSAHFGNLYAYYPYSSDSGVSVSAIPVTADNEDYMYATPQEINDHKQIGDTYGAVSLTMNHALAVAEIIVQNSTSNAYTGTGALTEVQMTSNAFCKAGSLDATSGKITATGTAEHSYTFSSLTTNLSSDKYTKTIILVPYSTSGVTPTISGTSVTGGKSTAEKWTFKAVVDGMSYTIQTGTSYDLTQGKKTTFTLSITNTGLTVSSVSIVDWGTADSADLQMNCEQTS